MAEARIDLHVHTTVSEDRERVALPHGASITVPFHPVLRPLEAYDLALGRGLTHVTLTDHDTIDGCLEVLDRHPDPSRLIVGEELTCYLGEIPFHVGVYGHNAALHRELHAGADRSEPQRSCLRWNLDRLLEFLDGHRLVYDLKHPIWQREGSPGGPGFLRELLPRFRRVEALNGTRCRALNELGARLASRFRRDVAFTAGSDTHSDNIGRCYTRTTGETTTEVLESLRAGHSEPVGRHGSHHLLEYDIRRCLASNLGRRAGLLVAVAGDFTDNLPQMVKEAGGVGLSALVAFAVVHEQARQRQLARQAAAIFEGWPREVLEHDPDLVASD